METETINEPCSGTDVLDSYLSARIGNVSAVRHKGIRHEETPCGSMGTIKSRPVYRLLFLLEGKVYLNGESIDKLLLTGKECILLPAGEDIKYSAILSSEFILMDVTELIEEGNSLYMQRLREASRLRKPRFAILPMKRQIEPILRKYTFYTGDSIDMEMIYDIFFLIFRSLYSEEEMLGLFGGMLQERETITYG